MKPEQLQFEIKRLIQMALAGGKCDLTHVVTILEFTKLDLYQEALARSRSKIVKPDGQMPPGMASVLQWVTIGFMVVFYVMVPAAGVLFYGSRHV